MHPAVWIWPATFPLRFLAWLIDERLLTRRNGTRRWEPRHPLTTAEQAQRRWRED